MELVALRDIKIGEEVSELQNYMSLRCDVL